MTIDSNNNNNNNNNSISNSNYSSRNNPNSNTTNRLLLYFILILGIIAIFVWTIFLIQISQLLESNIKQDVVANQTQSLINETQWMLHEEQGRAQQAEQILNQTRILIVEHQKDSENYTDKQNNTTRKLLTAINDAQKQNDIIIKVIQNQSKENKDLIMVYGPDNQKLLNEIKELLTFLVNSKDPLWIEGYDPDNQQEEQKENTFTTLSNNTIINNSTK